MERDKAAPKLLPLSFIYLLVIDHTGLEDIFLKVSRLSTVLEGLMHNDRFFHCNQEPLKRVEGHLSAFFKKILNTY